MNLLMKTLGIGLGLALVLSVAVAQEAEATNPVVIERQALMKTIGKNTKVLGDMAGGKTAFDAAAAGAAQVALAAAAEKIPAVFKANETDPESEAKPEIWSNWEDYLIKAAALPTAVAALDASTLEGLQAGMKGVGDACGSCHKLYRE